MSNKQAVIAMWIIQNQRINNYIQTTNTTVLGLLQHRVANRIRIINLTKRQLTNSSLGSSNLSQHLLSLLLLPTTTVILHNLRPKLSSSHSKSNNLIFKLLMLLCLRCFYLLISIRSPKWNSTCTSSSNLNKSWLLKLSSLLICRNRTTERFLMPLRCQQLQLSRTCSCLTMV